MAVAKLLAMIGALLIYSPSIAQFEKNYTPRETYSEKNRDLIKKVQKQLDNELRTLGSHRAQKIFKSNTQYLIKQIKQGAFLNDDTISNYIQKVFDKLLAANHISPDGKTLFVAKSPDINAICFGEGSFLVTVGLLRKIKNEGQLAFTLAHELAHYQLGHVKKKVIKMATSNGKKIINKEVDRIINGTVTLEDLEKLRELIYVKNRYSRAVEIEADSLGFVFFSKANYNQNDALLLIDQLDFTNFSNKHLDEKLFLPFHFRKFPFKQSWLNPRLGVYNKTPQKTFIFDMDSIKTHPDNIDRKIKLKSYIDSSAVSNLNTNNAVIDLLLKTAELEALESAYFSKRYDLALYLALELKPSYPHNDFINTMIVKILINIFEADENRALAYYVPNFTRNYHPELRKVNNFIHNADKKDLIEIAFHFLNQKSNFNQKNENHYFLLWKIAGISRRFSFQDSIINTYLEKFPEGAYKTQMR